MVNTNTFYMLVLGPKETILYVFKLTQHHKGAIINRSYGKYQKENN